MAKPFFLNGYNALFDFWPHEMRCSHPICKNSKYAWFSGTFFRQVAREEMDFLTNTKARNSWHTKVLAKLKLMHTFTLSCTESRVACVLMWSSQSYWNIKGMLKASHFVWLFCNLAKPSDWLIRFEGSYYEVIAAQDLLNCQFYALFFWQHFVMSPPLLSRNRSIESAPPPPTTLLGPSNFYHPLL